MNQRSDVSERKAESATAGEREAAMRPAVDVYETARGITLHADMPGVSGDGLTVQVDGDALLIEGVMALDVPEAMESLHADIRRSRFERRFTLSNELDAARIEARLDNGVLTLVIPRRAEIQPRKIKVRMA